MSLEHIFRNLNDIRVFDVMVDFDDDAYPIDIDDILEILDYPQREIIQIEDSVRHLVSQQILNITLVPEKASSGCDICKTTDELGLHRHNGHKDHIPAETKTYLMPKYYIASNELTANLISAVMANSYNFAKEEMK